MIITFFLKKEREEKEENKKDYINALFVKSECV